MTASAADTWYEAYSAARKAMDSGDWQTAEARLRYALSRQATQGRRVRAYGMRYISYLPDYDLGFVYLKQGRTAEAAAQFEKVLEAGLITPRDSEYAEAARVVAAVKPGPPVTVARVPTETAQAAPFPSVQIAAPSLPPASLAPKAPSGGETEAAPSSTDTRPARLQPALPLRTSPAEPPRPPSPPAAAPRRLDTEPPSTPSAPAAGGAVEQARLAISQKRWPDAKQVLRRLEDADSRNPALPSLRAAIERGLADANALQVERAGIRAFYAGKFRESAEILRALARRPPSARTHFYLACAAATLASLDGPGDASLLEEARSEIGKARQLDPGLTMNARYISPRVLNTLGVSPHTAIHRPAH